MNLRNTRIEDIYTPENYGEISIHCKNELQTRKVLEILHYKGFSWISGMLALDYIPADDDTTLVLWEDYKIARSDIQRCERDNRNIYPAYLFITQMFNQDSELAIKSTENKFMNIISAWRQLKFSKEHAIKTLIYEGWFHRYGKPNDLGIGGDSKYDIKIISSNLHAIRPKQLSGLEYTKEDFKNLFDRGYFDR